MTDSNNKLVKFRAGAVTASTATGPKLLCPISGTPLRAARANGGSFWYSPYSRGRLVTLVMAKHFLGNDGAREIWMRAERSNQFSEKRCPTCTKPMRIVTEPNWLGGFEVEVCTTCQVIWLDPGEHITIPEPEDLLTPEGDSTRYRDVGNALVELSRLKAEQEDRREALAYDGPPTLSGRLAGFMGLPVKTEEEAAPEKWWVTGGLLILMVLLQIFAASPDVIEAFGFYPSDPLKHFGLTIFSSVVLHGGWVHLLGNLYFFLMFSADVEGTLGSIKYAALMALLAVGGAIVLCVMSGSPELPHVGLSGVIMGLMVVYAFIHPHQRFAFWFPAVFTLTFNNMGYARIWGRSWVRAPIAVMVALYFASNLFNYILYESSGISTVSFSAHLGGALVGLAYSMIFIVPRESQAV